MLVYWNTAFEAKVEGPFANFTKKNLHENESLHASIWKLSDPRQCS